MADQAGEKTEQATPQRREDFRKKGQVAQSRELSTFLLLLGACFIIGALGSYFFQQIYLLFNGVYTDAIVAAARQGEYQKALLFSFERAAYLLLPVFLITTVLSFFSSVVQVGFLYNEEALQLKFDRLDPIQGLKRVFSLKSVVDGLKAIAKVLVVGSIVYLILRSEINQVGLLVEFSISQLMTYFGDVSLKLVIAVTIFMAILSGIDYAFQRWDLEQKMKMTKQEVKEETKNREGDPLIKARVRRTQREMAQKRMMADVPKADVIITNPTHISVAIQYQAGMQAPVLLAKGADNVAMKIREVAKEHGIPLVENKPLARTIYKTLKIGQVIPRELYEAVAEVLAYVYRIKRKKAGV